MRLFDQCGVFLLALLALDTTAQTEARSQADGASLLRQAADLVALRAPEGSGYRLKAHVQFVDANRKVTEGSYVYVSAPPNRVREETTFGDFQEIAVQAGEKRYQKRTLAYIPLSQWSLDTTLVVAPKLHLLPGENVKKVEHRSERGTRLTCIQLVTPARSVNLEMAAFGSGSTRTICLEEATGLPVSVDEPQLMSRFYYADFARLGSQAFPRHLRYLFDGKPVIEIQIEVLEQLGAVDPQWFDPPEKSDEWVICAGMTLPRVSLVAPRPAIPGAQRHYGIDQPGRIVYYLSVGRDGTVQSFRILERRGISSALDSLAQDLRAQKYSPASCRGTPIDFESVEQVVFPL